MVEMKDTVEKPTKDSESTDIVKPKNDAKSDTSDVEEINMTNGTMNPADDPKLKRLIELDTKYMSLENEYAVEWAALQKKYEEKQKPLLDERTEIVKKGDISSFWLQVLEGHPIFNDEIQEWDKPVLELCTNIRSENLPDESGKNQKGFKIIFEFDHEEGSEEYDALPFTNKSLTRVYETGLESEYLTEVTVKKIKMEEEIQWKIGKDITIEMKKVKDEGGNKKKGKAKAAAKEKVQKVERASIFRLFFRTISMEEPDTLKDLLDRSLMEMGFDAQEIDDEEELEQAYEDALEKVSDDAYEMGLALRDNIIPFAIRWYTGEACPMDDDEEDYNEDHDDPEDDDEDDDEDDSDEGGHDDSDEEGGKKKKDKDDGNPFKSGGDKSGLFKAKDGKEGDKKEECKQQ